MSSFQNVTLDAPGADDSGEEGHLSPFHRPEPLSEGMRRFFFERPGEPFLEERKSSFQKPSRKDSFGQTQPEASLVPEATPHPMPKPLEPQYPPFKPPESLCSEDFYSRTIERMKSAKPPSYVSSCNVPNHFSLSNLFAVKSNGQLPGDSKPLSEAEHSAEGNQNDPQPTPKELRKDSYSTQDSFTPKSKLKLKRTKRLDSIGAVNLEDMEDDLFTFSEGSNSYVPVHLRFSQLRKKWTVGCENKNVFLE